MANHGKEHLETVRWICRYLHGSSNVCFHFGGRGEEVLLSTLTSILLEFLIKENLLLGMCLLLEVVLSVGKLLCRLQLCCLLLKQNVWLLQKLVRKLFG